MRIRNAVVFDVDGTLCDVSSIRHLVKKGASKARDFKAFHEGASDCPPIEWVVQDVVNFYMMDFKILIVTARSEMYRARLETWLRQKAGLPLFTFDKIYMRPDKDFRPDREVKEEIYQNILEDGFDPFLAYDDNPSIVEMWRDKGIPVMVVPGWEE